MKSLATAVLFALAISVFLVSPTLCFTVSECRLIVYRDGVVHVHVRLTVSETEPAVSIPLLAGDAYNILAVDEDREPLSYDVDDATLTIYTFGATDVAVEYDTNALTSNEAGVWTLKLATSFPLTVALPENSTVMCLSSTPAAIEVEGSTTILVLQPGDWQVSYALPEATVTVAFSVSGVDSDALGVILVVDKFNTYTCADLPKSFTWYVGSLHSFLWFKSVDAESGKRYAWASTSGLSTTQNGTITVPASGGAVSALYKTQYRLEASADKGEISLNPPSPGTGFDYGWYDSGTNVTATAIPLMGCVFNHWVLDGADAGSSNPITVFMNSPHKLTAIFNFSTPSLMPFPQLSPTSQPLPSPQNILQWIQSAFQLIQSVFQWNPYVAIAIVAVGVIAVLQATITVLRAVMRLKKWLKKRREEQR